MASETLTILDACVLINLAASDEIADICASIEGVALVCTAARNEALFLRDEIEPGTLVPLNLDELLAVGQIRVCDIATDDEEEEFVRLAGDLDDGEAMGIAIATSRGLRFASDDQKARRVFLELAGASEQLTCTSAILKRWAETRNVAPQRLRNVLRRIAVRARFTPARRDPNAEWWQRSVF
jgi:predicted nucleic acid-binding protein